MANDAVSGGLAAVSSCVLLQPLEVYKTRLQERAPLPRHYSQYWRGTTVTLARNVPGVALYFTCLQHLRYLSIVCEHRFPSGALINPINNQMTTMGHLISGGGARIIAGFMLMPLTVVKTMFESDRFKRVSGLTAMFHNLYTKNGVKGLFKGFSVTALRDAPHAAIYVAIYEHSKRAIGTEDSLGTCAVAGLCAGATATIITQPFDTIKTNIQLERYDGVTKAVRGIYAGGVFGFYRGTMPRFLRKTLSSAITWTVMENALARAEELLAVNQPSAALQLLYDAITSRHFQHNLLALEPIVSKFVELCVELRQGRFVKDGLQQYRTFSQTTNMQAFEQTVRKFVGLAERRLEEAIKSSDSATTTTASDAVQPDADPAVEEISRMLQAQLSIESGKSTVDRQTVLPWMRFMWEALRAALEVCRNNQKLERLYFELVCKSFDYCQKYQRKSELKRLAETLRYHLVGIIKSANHSNPQPMAIILTGESASADSQQIQLDIRYRQLDVALEMELWQEAFRSIEDIHGLFLMGGRSADILLSREEYFEKVARIFAMSENTLFYSAALIRRLQALTADHSEAVKESVKRQIAVSLLSVPLGSNAVTESVFSNSSWSFLEDQHGRATRLAYFLGLDTPPTHQSMLAEAVGMSIVGDGKVVEVLSAFSKLEYQKCTLGFVGAAYAHLMATMEEAKRFSAAIAHNLVYLHVKCLESQQQPLNINQLEQDCTVAFEQPISILQLLTKWTRSNDCAVTIDQSTGVAVFNPRVSLLSDPSPVFMDFEDAKTVYMHRLCLMLQSKSESAFAACKALFEKLEAARRESVKRQEAADRAREERELARKEREREEAKDRAARIKAEQEAETRRLSDEAAQRERDRVAKEREIIRKQEQKKKEDDEKRLAELSGMRANLDRLQLLSVRLDHIERAIRHEELPLLEADFQQQLIDDKSSYERHVSAVKETSVQEYTEDRRLFGLIAPHERAISSFLAKLHDHRLTQRESRQHHLDQQYEVAKQERIAQIAREKELLKAKPVLIDSSLGATAIGATGATGATGAIGGKYVPPSMGSSAGMGSSTGAWRRDTAVPVAVVPAVAPALAPAVAASAPEKAKYVPPHLKNRQ